MRRADLQAAVGALFPNLPRANREHLLRVPGSAHAASDTAACLLGRNLWLPPLAEFRDYLLVSGERPHLWTFNFGPSAAWDGRLWNALALSARLLRTRAGSLSRCITVHASPWSLQMNKRRFNEGLADLTRSGLCRRDARDLYILQSIATLQELYVDLALIEIIAHWLWMLAHRDRVLADRHATGFEVHGYAEACGRCRTNWGLRARDAQWVPPFHPGCRCFAQPRFTTGS
jgi:hypothetical protein